VLINDYFDSDNAVKISRLFWVLKSTLFVAVALKTFDLLSSLRSVTSGSR
jgi:hypothetical protein